VNVTTKRGSGCPAAGGRSTKFPLAQYGHDAVRTPSKASPAPHWPHANVVTVAPYLHSGGVPFGTREGLAVFWTRPLALATIAKQTRGRLRCFPEVVMIAVIGNVIAGLGVLSLFTATLRLTRPPRA
jgi:hypothetical protein